MSCIMEDTSTLCLLWAGASMSHAYVSFIFLLQVSSGWLPLLVTSSVREMSGHIHPQYMPLPFPPSLFDFSEIVLLTSSFVTFFGQCFISNLPRHLCKNVSTICSSASLFSRYLFHRRIYYRKFNWRNFVVFVTVVTNRCEYVEWCSC